MTPKYHAVAARQRKLLYQARPFGWRAVLLDGAAWILFRLLFGFRKGFFPYAAQRTDKIGGQVRKAGARFDSVVWVAQRLIVLPSAHVAYIFLHVNPSSVLILTDSSGYMEQYSTEERGLFGRRNPFDTLETHRPCL